MRHACGVCGGEHLPNQPVYLLDCYQRGYARLKADIAAAEERGRRRGVEERDVLLRRARDWLEFMAEHPGDGNAKNLIASIDAALAPRDSVPLAPPESADYPCSAPGNMGIAPRDSGKGDGADAWGTPRPPAAQLVSGDFGDEPFGIGKARK